ncbi:TetR/AcrR family transcriptional regulator [Paenibacillus sp. JDR-2]|uniref:TetR/AcrR family transcriptional regulator n=1 Tax=Paenibacillus sp. (strain JDR-2) TaxID=324057 RepID=UPI00016679A3|nr:TetR/AcrR family transcriptional regulator [Paenibacillus sp. JDR-2]ACT02321.1 transcriptional regulator, TetR family [Paenibacillus sp. JDR-2]
MITTKENMCELAIQMFKEMGFEQVSINMICNQLKVTRGSFYHHFSSKNDLLLFWFSSQVEKNIAVDMSLASPKRILKKQTMDYAAIIHQVGHDLMYHILMAEFELEGRHFYTYLHAEDQSVSLIHKAIELQEIHSAESAKKLFDAYTAAMVGAIVMWKFDNGQFDIADKIESIFDTIFS